MKKEIRDILKENKLRNDILHAAFNPITGEGSVGERAKFKLSDFSLPVQYLPIRMFKIPLVAKLQKAKSIKKFIHDELEQEYSDELRDNIIETFVRLRYRYDFCFWAAVLAYIKNKGGGDDVLFRPTYPQRKILAHLEDKRLANKAIRLIILKARQLGGSTLIQMYFAWLQLEHKRGLNSLIISLQAKASDEIYDMYDRLIKAYPLELLYKIGEAYNEKEPKFVGVGASGAIHRVPQRNCKIKLGSAEKPDSCRGGDYNLVHLSEVGLWKKTDGKSPEDIVQGSCSGIPLKPYTAIIYESTARGTGNFFHREYIAAKEGKSQFDALFIPWFIVPLWYLNFDSEKEKEEFAQWLYANRENANRASDREEPGRYLWYVWNLGASLEALHWYVVERSARSSHSAMSSEYPSDDVEAFTDIDSGEFDRYQVEKFRPSCRAPKFVGEVYADGDEGELALQNLRFKEDGKGMLWIWAKPEIDPDYITTDRYLVVVDIGGRSDKADWSVITVFDRMMMADGGKPSVVAQWYGHIDMDILAWKAAQIAAYYDNAKLVIESNTLETHDKERYVDGDQSGFILNLIKNVYPNLYARRQTEDEIKEKMPRKYGFHTNIATKPVVISTLKKCIREQLYTERDERCLHQYLVYERKPNGSLGAVAGDHDDLLMTRAIGLQICFFEMPLPEIHKKEIEPKQLIHNKITYRNK